MMHPAADSHSIGEDQWDDLASIESSLSPDPSLDELLFPRSTSPTGQTSPGDLDPLLLFAPFQQHIQYSFESDSPALSCTSVAPSSSFSSPPLSPFDGSSPFQCRRQEQARRNAELAALLSPIRKFQERLQSAQRRVNAQKVKRKFSLKNGPSDGGIRRPRNTVNNSVRRWRAEMAELGRQNHLKHRNTNLATANQPLVAYRPLC